MDFVHAAITAVAALFAGAALGTQSTAAPVPPASPPGRPPRVADDDAVRCAAETLGAYQRQVARLQAQIDAARGRLEKIEAGALRAEAEGSPAALALAAARQDVAATTELFSMAALAERDAERAYRRALKEARARLKPAHLAFVEGQLDELEALLWRVLDVQAAIHHAMTDAAEEKMPLVSAAYYWSSGFPGFPAVRDKEDILCWLRNRSLAPRETARHAKTAPALWGRGS
jgi:hypothetical protein